MIDSIHKSSLLRNSQHWRERAEEARVLSEQMSDEESKRTMLSVAYDYERLATRASMLEASSPLVKRL